jgi:two-component sensor histidine kinase
MLFRLLKKVNKQKDIISKALSDKDILIKEIHHRVKNNLQLISSLLTLQGRGIDDKKAKSAIQDGKNRVRSMALIHQDLYMKDKLKDINLKSYLEKLTTDLFLTYKIDHSSIELKLDIDDIDLDVDTIVPLGLIINELITNSLKYAFPDNNKGILKVSLKEKYETLELEIVDNGVGFEAENVRNDSFGTTLISALTRQLRGKLTTDSSNGTKTILTIPNETKNQ